MFAAAAFVVANLFNALNKGGDFTVFLESGRRFLDGLSLYSGSGVASGVIGPPFQAVFFTPFAWSARANEVAARISWYSLNVMALGAGVAWWKDALDPATDFSTSLRWWEQVTTRDVLLALLAISFPLQANFEHQNMNAVLLAATGAAAAASRRGRDVSAGTLIGLATALKAFPALLLAYFALKGRVRLVAWGTATALALTALPVLRYGVTAWTADLGDWVRLSGSGGWPTRSHNQSLFALCARWLGPEGLTATGGLAVSESPVTYLVWSASVVALVSFCWTCLLRVRHESTRAAAEDMAIVIGIAVLVSPIAWDHYWVLFFPAFYLARIAPRHVPNRLLGRTFWVALVLTSGPAVAGRTAWRVSRWLSAKTIAGLLLVVVLSLALMWWRQRAVASPRPVAGA